MADIKLQFVAGKARTDMRGPLLIGKEQGDHHDTIKEFRVEADVADALLPVLEIENQRTANAIGAQLDILEAHIPGAKAAALAALTVFEHENVSDAEVIGFQTRIYDND